MIKNQNIVMWIVSAGLLLVMAGTLLPLLRLNTGVWRYVYAAGALILIYGRIATAVPAGASTRLRRLFRLETWSAAFFCVATFFIFYEHAGAMDWLAFTLAGGAVQVYTSIMIPRMIRKENL